MPDKTQEEKELFENQGLAVFYRKLDIYDELIINTVEGRPLLNAQSHGFYQHYVKQLKILRHIEGG